MSSSSNTITPLKLKCLTRTAPDCFSLSTNTPDSSLLVYLFSAQEMRLYLQYDMELRQKGFNVPWSPIGYEIVASAFNAEVPHYKFAMLNYANESTNSVNSVLYTDTPSPPVQALGVQANECFDPDEITACRKGFVSLKVKEYEELKKASANLVRSMMRGREKAERAREVKREEKAALKAKKLYGDLVYAREEVKDVRMLKKPSTLLDGPSGSGMAMNTD